MQQNLLISALIPMVIGVIAMIAGIILLVITLRARERAQLETGKVDPLINNKAQGIRLALGIILLIVGLSICCLGTAFGLFLPAFQ